MTEGNGFSPKVKEKLKEAVGFHCSAPFCNAQTNTYNHSLGKQQFTGEAAHIYGLRGGTANRPGAARYDELPPGLDPNSYENGIWLCRVCHRMVDQSPELFRGEDLVRWKQVAEHAHNESGRRRLLVPIGVDMKQEYEKAKNFVAQLFPLAEFMHNVIWQPALIDPVTKQGKVSREVIFAIGTVGCRRLQPKWNAEHPHWTFLPDFQVWKTEIVRRAEVLSYMDGVSFVESPPISFKFQTTENERIFEHPTARAIHQLVKLRERFETFLTTYQGPYAGLVSYPSLSDR